MDTSSQFQQLQQLQQADHDTLVRVETKVDGFTENITSEIKRISADLTNKLADHEARLRYLEKSHDTFNPEAVKLQLDALQRSSTTYRINWKVVGIMTSVLVFVISTAAIIVGAYISAKLRG